MNDELVQRCKDHIAGYRATLYGQTFDVGPDSDLDAAAEWLAAEIRAVLG